MPPKQNARGRRSQLIAPDLIPIYEILVDKQKQNGVRELIKKIDALGKHDIAIVQKSFFIFILKVCGLDSCIDKIDWKQSTQSISDLLEEMCEQNQKSVFVNELFLINLKSKFHNQFTQRIKQFLQAVISDQLPLISDSAVMKSTYELLLTISRCKMRNIRNCSIVMSSLVMKRSKEFYEELSNQGSNKRASKLLTIIDEGYLSQIIKPRLKDIDPQIRQKSFQILCSTLLMLNKQLLTPNRLSQYFTQTLADNKPKITELCLKSIIKIFDADKQKMGATANRNLESYAVQIIKVLEQLVLLPNKNSCLAMEALLSIYNFNPRLDALKPRIIAKIFEIHGYEKFQEGLKKAVLIFFKSLVPFSSKQELNEHRPLLLIQITHLLCSINSSKLLETILYQFFGNYSGLFGFDDMFLLLLTEYYHRDGSDIELQEKELSVICTMICEFNLYVRKDLIKQDIREKQQGLYNKNVLTNCKEIYYEKIAKHPSMAQMYLRLFSLLFIPVSGTLSSYLDFISQKTLDFIKQEKYVSLAGDNLVSIQQTIHECAAIWKRVSADGTSLRPLLKSFDSLQMVDKDKLSDIQIIKASALVSHFEVEELLTEKMMRKILNSYRGSQQKVIKLQSITFAYHCHRRMFISLFNNPTQSSHREYIEARGILMQLIFQTILNSSSQQTIVKLGALSILCKTLNLVSNSKISDLPVVYFDPNNDQIQILFNFVGQYIRFDDQPSVGQLSMMMSSISLENQQIKQQIMQNLFTVFAGCYRLALHKQSIRFITKCMHSNHFLQNVNKHLQMFFFQLIKTEISKQNNNRFVYWRVFGEIMFEVSQQEEEKINAILIKLIDIYYKFRKGQSQTKSLLTDFIDKSVSNTRYEDLNIIKRLLERNYRRFPKQTLQRLSIFFASKIQGNQDKTVIQMKQFLNKIGKVGKKKKSTKNSKEDSNQESSSEQDQQKEKDKQNESQNDQELQDRRANSRRQQNIMIEKKAQGSRTTRSRTKKKNQ